MARRPAPDPVRELTPKQQRFVDEYLVDLNATQAAIRAGYSERTARQAAAENLSKPDIAAAVAEGKAKRAERTGITADKVLQQWWDLAHADTNELVEYRVHCCRHCYGDGFGYQRTKQEMARDRDLGAKAGVAFDKKGGIGYDRRKAPNPECPECFGEGVGDAHFKDTRHLSPTARRLYAGVKVTKEGIEVKTHDPMAALANVAKHLGMFTERHEVRMTIEDLLDTAEGQAA